MTAARRVASVLGALLLASCVATPPNGAPDPHPEARADPIPAGNQSAGGALRLDQISVTLQLGATELRVTALHERVIRLAAPDVRLRLLPLLPDPTAEVDAAHESRFLVTFSSRVQDAEFFPADVRFEIGGVRLETVSIVPITSGWGSQRLRVREPESAIYRVRGRFDPYSSLRVLYGPAASDAWRDVIPVLRAEERRVG